MNETKTESSKTPFKKDEAYEKLKELILTDHFPEGSFLSERSLATQLGMSKTPIRSAVERLESEGFLIVSHKQGMVVKPLAHSEIIDSFDLSLALEKLVVRRLAGKLTPRQVEVLEQKIAKQEECIDSYNVNRAIETDIDFHISLCEFLGNKEILRVVWRQRDILYRVKHQIYQKENYQMLVEKNQLAHKELLGTLKKGHGELAAKLIENYMEFWKKLLLLSVFDNNKSSNLLSDDDYEGFFGLNTALEKYAVGQLAGKLTTQQITALEQKIAKQKKYINNHDLELAVETELDFHTSFYEFLDNKQILNIAKKNRGVFYRIQYTVYSKNYKKQVEKSQLANTELLKTLKKGDGELAAKLVGQYIKRTKQLFKGDSLENDS